MNIAVNTRLLLKGRLEGIGWFTFETMKRITQQHPEHHFFFLFDREPHSDYLFSSNITSVVLKPQARHPLLWLLWFELSLRRFLRENRIDLFLSPDGFLPLRAKVPCIAVIHDINFVHYPAGIPLLTRLYYNHFFPKFARKASRIVTVSQYSKNDIVSTFGIAPTAVSVAHNGANEAYIPLSEQEVEATRQKYTGGKPYFVFVGALSPRKNVARLINAFDRFVKATGLDHKLVIVGEPMFMTNDIKQALDGIGQRGSVVLAGRLQVSELRYVMGAATALVYTPYFEGFGIPLVEAMRCHVPIVASTRTSIPEVAGDAAYYVDPFDVDAIAKAMELLATDPDLRQALAGKAAARKILFSWDKTAQVLYEAIEHELKKQKVDHA